MALRVEEEVAGFEISVKEVGRVHIFEAFEALIDNILFVDVFKDVCSDYSV